MVRRTVDLVPRNEQPPSKKKMTPSKDHSLTSPARGAAAACSKAAPGRKPHQTRAKVWASARPAGQRLRSATCRALRSALILGARIVAILLEAAYVWLIVGPELLLLLVPVAALDTGGGEQAELSGQERHLPANYMVQVRSIYESQSYMKPWETGPSSSQPEVFGDSVGHAVGLCINEIRLPDCDEKFAKACVKVACFSQKCF